jgi:hypothetical protein
LEEAAPVYKKVAAPFEDAAVVWGDAAEALVEEEKTAEIATEVAEAHSRGGFGSERGVGCEVEGGCVHARGHRSSAGAGDHPRGGGHRAHTCRARVCRDLDHRPPGVACAALLQPYPRAARHYCILLHRQPAGIRGFRLLRGLGVQILQGRQRGEAVRRDRRGAGGARAWDHQQHGDGGIRDGQEPGVRVCDDCEAGSFRGRVERGAF